MTKTVFSPARWIPLLILALALGHLTPAWAANARLRGTVLDGQGDPIEGVQVTLVSESGGTHLTAETNDRGRFRMLIVDPTHPPYVLTIEKEGYQPLEEVVQLRANDATSWEAVMAPSQARPSPEAEEGTVAGDPEAVELYNEGAALYNEGQVAEAVAKFEEAVAIDPSLLPAHRILADLYTTQGRHKDALRTAERVLELAPGDSDAALVRYDALQGLGRTDEARQALDRLVETGDPGEVAKRVYNAAVQTQKGGGEEEALALFRRSVELDPELAPAWSAIAGIELARNEPQAAVEAAARLLELQPGDNEALTIQYEAYQAMGETEKAQELLAELEGEGEAQDPDTLYRRGVAFFNSSNYEQAATTLQQAVEMDPDLAGARYTLGLALLNQEDQEGALRHLRRFLELDPDHPDAESARQMVQYLENE
ncbi:MAG: tetratricopeptide repeat protein [Thermoanaerobaculia bacterium]